ncbi:MAG: tetratricopeptide repeat protein, partial [Chitinophagaceae bacterium]
MKPTICMILFCCLLLTARSQDAASRYINDGVDLHDRGYLEEAILKYDSALRLDPKHYLANYEKALTLTELKRYTDAAALCNFVLREHPDSASRLVYVLYGTLLDYQGQGDEAVRIYTKGIRKNPDSYILYFNRAVSYAQQNKADDAEADLAHALARNPYHPGSHNLMARLQESTNPVYSLLATAFFLALEQRGERATAALQRLDRLLGAGVEQKDEKNISISVFMPSEKDKKKENEFSRVNLLMSLTAASVMGEHKNDAHADRIRLIMSGAIASLSVPRKEDRGFGWRFYAPVLADLEKAGHLEAWAHLA